MVDIKTLTMLVEVVRRHSFSAAAEHLFVTQPTISKAINSLEQELGVSLFQKGESGRKREVTLTYMGELIYQHAQNILAEQQKLYATVAQVGSLKKGKLTLGLPPLGSVLLSALIARFHERYPDIQLIFLEVGANGIEQALADKSIDVGILLGAQLRPDFAGISIIESPMYVLSHEHAQWRGREQIALRELQHEPFLLYSDTFTLNNLIVQAAHGAGFEPKVVCKSSQWEFIVKMVESNMGIALLPQVFAEQVAHLHINQAKLVEPQLNWHLSMAWNTTAALSPAAQAWTDIVAANKQHIHF
ncbi:LysR substrate-binding domain-containing protein [Vitreoscilla massiliensis]|uniref:LysR substrate-binding domain-containing protein n=1 Tax=Vitreoscilla massiliensis TaxID=1689272 RepID=A0ABY4E4M5_9NEIS|nr:LysR substrate-binding domain-containing protein [Vitreoscilla massiliensis]UOO90697.1 LysR substrate-binding domain-containing protein [Vitreoscilla massiliensis]